MCRIDCCRNAKDEKEVFRISQGSACTVHGLVLEGAMRLHGPRSSKKKKDEKEEER